MNQESKHDIKAKIRQRYKGGDVENMHMIPARAKESLFDENTEKKVCAYCRVSTDDPRQTSSYELQKNHYEEFIKDHPGWVLVGIYADEGITGTSMDKRDEFNRMIADCQQGKIELIVCKSVARFARNIVDSIQTVRMLQDMKPPVGVFFETEHMSTLDSTSGMDRKGDDPLKGPGHRRRLPRSSPCLRLRVELPDEAEPLLHACL